MSAKINAKSHPVDHFLDLFDRFEKMTKHPSLDPILVGSIYKGILSLNEKIASDKAARRDRTTNLTCSFCAKKNEVIEIDNIKYWKLKPCCTTAQYCSDEHKLQDVESHRVNCTNPSKAVEASAQKSFDTAAVPPKDPEKAKLTCSYCYQGNELIYRNGEQVWKLTPCCDFAQYCDDDHKRKDLEFHRINCQNSFPEQFMSEEGL